MTEENQSVNNNNTESDIKEQLYILYLEIKGEITKKNIEIDQEQFDDYVRNVKLSTLIHYIKQLIYMLINKKCPEQTPAIPNDYSSQEIMQLESHIKKLEYDTRYYIQREFQTKIQRDALEMKLNAYMEMENEFEDLKEKVKYDEGKFLNNDRKDNEIMILRRENTILKDELAKNNEKNKTNEITIEKEHQVIQDLNNHISNLNEKITHLEMISLKENKPNTNNSSINININNNGGSESKWVIKQEDNNENSGIVNNNNSNLTLKKKNYTKNTFTKNYGKYGACNLNLASREPKRDFNGFQIKNGRSSNNNKGTTTIDNNNAFAATYNKILNNLSIKGNRTPVKKEIKKKQMKKNGSSVSMCDEYDKSMGENKYMSNKGKTRYKSNIKNNGYCKIMGLIPNSKFPLTSKHQFGKNNTSSLNKKYLHREKSSVNHSAFNIK